MKKIFALMFVCMSVVAAACTTNDDSEAIKALDDNGFSEIQITERGVFSAAWEGCDEKDGAWYRASATNSKGKHVNMLVCCGGPLQFKGCTVRSK